MHGHPGHKISIFVQGDTNERPETSQFVRREVGSRWRFGHDVIDHVWTVFAQYLALSVAEVGHPVPADDACHLSTGIVAHNDKVIFVRFNLGIRTPVDGKIFSQHSDGGRRNLTGVGERKNRLIEVRHKHGSFFCTLGFRTVGRRTDDLAHASVLVTGKDPIPATKPSPSAIAIAYSKFKFLSFIAQVGQSLEVIQKAMPVVRV